MAQESEATGLRTLSDYAKNLLPPVKKRYCEKISCIGIDPILIAEKKYDPECLPPVESVDILSFLVLETSYYTRNQFKAFRSLQAYNQMVSGFINSVQGHMIAGKYVVLGKVRHSQRMNDPCVSIWIITEKDGTILSAHCAGCMAGQGECCSHVASVLFYLETWNRINGKLACTQVKCTWIMPTYVKEVNYAEVRNINFTSAKKLKQNLDKKVDSLGQNENLNTPSVSATTKTPVIPKPTADDLDVFYKKLHSCKSKPVALSLVHPFSETYISKSRDIPTVTELFDKKFLNLSYSELLSACSEVKLELSKEQIKLIEVDTRSQSKGSSFFRHRAGRIGASLSKAASCSNPAQPSQSLIKSICYPNIFKFTTVATEYGCKHEAHAVEAYKLVMSTKHENFRVAQCGTFISQSYPWLHATPDFLSYCDCCGEGCGEVKCPYCLKDSNFDDYLKRKNASLHMENGMLVLKRQHQYYYQVQQQLFITGWSFCDFVVCGLHDQTTLVIERIVPDKQHWDLVLPKLNHFWRYCILPEILGRWYTRKCNLLQESTDPKAVCFCRMDIGESVVTCANDKCPINNYHISCLKVTEVPKNWYCPLCQRLEKKKSVTKALDEIVKKAMELEAICMCKAKPLGSDKLIECHSSNCQNGKFFHLQCTGYKRLPNNAKTTWMCTACKAANAGQNKCSTTKSVCKGSKCDNDILITHTTKGIVDKHGALSNLSEEQFELILSSTGWLDCDIIQQVHVCLQKLNFPVEGLQRPTLGPCRNFNEVSGEFVQILHTGNSHWVCVSSLGCVHGEVNLYDSLYHNVIDEEVKSQVSNLVGPTNFTGLNVIPVQQQRNGSDCGIFAAAFATCLVFGVSPEGVQFDVSKMRSHLYSCLKNGALELFPTC